MKLNLYPAGMKSMSEADQIVVLDTGSTDSTVEQLRALGGPR